MREGATPCDFCRRPAVSYKHGHYWCQNCEPRPPIEGTAGEWVDAPEDEALPLD